MVVQYWAKVVPKSSNFIGVSMLTRNNKIVIALWLVLASLIVVFPIIGVSDFVRQRYSNHLQDIAALLGAFWCYRAGFFFSKGNPRRILWNIWGTGLLSWGLGALVSTVYLLVAGEEVPYPYYSDIGYLLMIVFFLLGLLFLKTQLKLFPPFLGFFCAEIVLVVSIVISSLVEKLSGTPIHSIVSIAYICLDSALFATTIFVFFCQREGFNAKSWWLVTIGITCYFFAEQLYSYLVSIGKYETGSVIDILWVFAFGLVAVAAMISVNERTDIAN